MNILYAPWRSDYAGNARKGKTDSVSGEDCVFCVQLKETDDVNNFIVKRYEHNAIFLNRYPYNAGHLLIIPYAHISTLESMNPQARAELIELTSQASTVVRSVLGAYGVNIGINEGKWSGAGIPSHLHLHVLPRWPDDTNFLPLLANTKQISFDLKLMYQKIKAGF